ncbi:aminotransferase class I/II-fold pyridoxal phosphate-dependent enzyme, partial [Eubacteriales bacterium OttesenSCG-928-N14]|nr:aminotransferase class I/II-fold pyridoxal phosphate-dependent enzyme [Eubacteriales bacterium OttesenSCG-928-N14]
ASQARIRFCMPGHGGKLHPLDITELPGVDNLLQPQGALLQAQQLAADAFGAAQLHYSVNGASACVAALILAAAQQGETIIVSRDCHRSTASGLVLSGAMPVYAQPAQGALPLGADIHAIESAIAQHPHAKAVLVTYPNYYGVCCDIAAIANLCRQNNMALLVDGAHGAHFAFSDQLPVAPTMADGWAVSMHKTLYAPNQSAALCLGRQSRLDAQRLFASLSMLQTTSPSWPMLLQMDLARSKAALYGAQAYDALIGRIQAFYRKLDGIAGLVYEYALPKGYTRDATRIVLDVSALGIRGYKAMAHLHQCGIAGELADESRLVLIATIAHDDAAFHALYEALCSLPRGNETIQSITAPVLGETHICPRTAWQAPQQMVPLQAAAGRVAAQAVGVYPPGIAAILPGDVITCGQIRYLSEQQAAGGSITGLYSNAGVDMVYCMQHENTD